MEREGDTQSGHSSGSMNSDEVSLVTIQFGWITFNPISRKGRALHLFQMLILPFIPIVALIVQNAVIMQNVLQYQIIIREIANQVVNAVDVGDLLRALQLERTELAYNVFSNASSNLRQNITKTFDRTDLMLEQVSRWPDVKYETDSRAKIFKSKVRFQVRLEDFRDSVDPLRSQPQDVIGWYNSANSLLIDILVKRIRDSDASGLWRSLVSYKNILRCGEQMGISTVFGAVYYLRGRLDQESWLAWVESNSLAFSWLNRTLLLSPSIHYTLRKQEAFIEGLARLEKNNDLIFNTVIQSSLERADQFLLQQTQFLDTIRGVEADLVQDIRELIADYLDQANQEYSVALAVLVLVLVLSPIIIILVRRTTVLIHHYATNLLKRSTEVKKEKKKSDNLLYQLLPKTVATYLRNQRQVPAEYFECVTIYLSDIVGFTKISSECTPIQVVTLLNALYKQFDQAIEEYDVFKIETIGDAYMVVSGLPNRNGVRHAEEIADMSLVLLDTISAFELPHRPGERLRVRIGLHSGPCVAGVVGTRMPRYCMFGKTVTVAHFMEGSGEPMRIHVSETTYELLADINKFRLSFRGPVQVFAKYRKAEEREEVHTYWLDGRVGEDKTLSIGRQRRKDDNKCIDNTPLFLTYVNESTASVSGSSSIHGPAGASSKKRY